MATEAQILANRENAKRSTGPRTETGKQISSANACQHCLTGGPDVAPGESQEEFEAHMKAAIDDYGPATGKATFTVTQIGKCTWKLLRCDRWEAQILASCENAFDDETVARKLERLEKYRQSIERSYHRWVKEWRNLMADDLKEMKFQAAASEKAMLDYLNAPMPTSSVPRTVPEQRRE